MKKNKDRLPLQQAALLRYILRRLLIALPVLVGITLIDYLIMSMAGNPLEMLIGPRISQEAIRARELQLGLDKPFLVQYVIWLKQIFSGNFGYSIKDFQPVAAKVLGHLGPTLLLMGSSLLLSLLIAVPAGIYSAIRQYTKADYAIVSASFIGTSIPGFFLGLVFLYIFHVRLGYLPASGMRTLGGGGGFVDVFRHLLMPMLVLTISGVGSNIRYIRASMLEILQQDYLRSARAKGVGPRRLILRHALRNALVPILTVIGMQVPLLFGGTVIIEQIYSWPGLGLLTMQAIFDRDYPVIMAVCLLSAIVVLVANLITDILYALVDPSIRYD